MVKLICGIILMLIAFYGGYCVDKYYKGRVGLISDFKRFLLFAGREARYLKTDIFTVINGYESSSRLKGILQKIKDGAEKGEKIEITEPLLRKNEKEQMSEFFTRLFTADGATSEKVFKKSCEEFNDIETAAIAEKKNKGELWKKLLILFGVAVLILCI
ncbi:MAG: hypothetical protein LBN25_03785 [Christensenellaceae bacterium]|nr:hypothetical protein [Christensenellaceae bacterium]